MHLLVVEDDLTIADQLQQLLQKEKYVCDVVYGYQEALRSLDEKSFDALLLDWNLSDGDGLTLLSRLRSEGVRTPVLMLSANNTVDDRVKVLDAGADDYLCKPYSNVELLARLRALLRRESTQKVTILTLGDVTLDLTRHEVDVADEGVTLSASEFDLLEVLMLNKNIVLTRYQLSDHICKDLNSYKHSNLVDVHIKNLRKKLQRPELITTVRGVGYTIKDI
ncbi:response regulator transcription factor [bacterium]|nr:response regulator transcription factor [bacterium]